MKRLTNKDFVEYVKILSREMNTPLNHNVWHKHFSVYTAKDGTDQWQLVHAQTAKDAIAQIGAIRSALYIQNKLKGEV